MSDQGASSRRARLAAAAALAFAAALLIRSGAFSGPLEFDEADYTLAARLGFLENWWAESLDSQELRHRHAPLQTYFIDLAVGVFGLEPWAIRLPGVIASALACAAIVLAVHDLARRADPPLRLGAAAVAGLLLATAPASVRMTHSAKPHSFVELFLVLNLWALCRYTREPGPRAAALLGATIGMQFAAMEYGLIVAVACAAAVALTHPGRLLTREPLVCAGTGAAALLVLWPAGLLKAAAALNLHFYVRLAAEGRARRFQGEVVSALPRWAYLWYYATGYPLLLGAMAAGGGLALARVRRAPRDPVAVSAAVFLAATVGAVHTSQIRELPHTIFAIPPLVAAAALSGAALGTRPHRRALLAVLAGAWLAGGVHAPAETARAPRPSHSLGRRLAEIAEPGALVLSTSRAHARFAAHLERGRGDLRFESLDPRRVASRRYAERIRGREFGWVVLEPDRLEGFPATGVEEALEDARYETVAREGGARLLRRPRGD